MTETKEPAQKRQRLNEVPEDQFKRLPSALLTELWSFIHVLEVPDLVPDRDHFKASLLSRKTSDEFVIDDTWSRVFAGKADRKFWNALSRNVVALFSPTRVKTVTIDIVGFALDPVILHVTRTFREITALHVTDRSKRVKHFNIVAVTSLVASATIRDLSVKVGQRASDDVRQAWENSDLRAMIAPGQLDDFGTNLSFFFVEDLVEWGGMTQASAFTHRVYENCGKELAQLVKRMPLLKRLGCAVRGHHQMEQREHESNLLNLFSEISAACPGLTELHIDIRFTMDYPAASTFEPLLSLKSLVAIILRTAGKEIAWKQQTCHASYDEFTKRALVAWPSIKYLELDLPLSQGFFEDSEMVGGSRLRFLSIGQASKLESCKVQESIRRWSNGGPRRDVRVGA